jgi:hypothetical protein
MAAAKAATAKAATAKAAGGDTLTDMAEYLRVHNPDSLRDLDVMCSSARRTTAPRLKHALFKLHGTPPAPSGGRGGTSGDATDMAWPRSTPLPCWNCFHPFSGVPLAVPLHRDPQTGVFTMDAVLCSPACGLRYIADTAGSTAGMQTMLFREAVRSVFGIREAYAMAPERRWLRAFCGADMPGALSIEEYRGSTSAVNMRTLRPPFVPATVLLEMTSPADAAAAPTTTPVTTPPVNPTPKKQQQAAAAAAAAAAAGGAAAAAILASGGHAIRGLRRPPTDAPGSPPQKPCSVSMAGGEVDPAKPLYLDYVAKRDREKEQQQQPPHRGLPLAPPQPRADEDDVLMADAGAAAQQTPPPPPSVAARKARTTSAGAAKQPAPAAPSGFGSLSQFIAAKK